MKQTCTSSTTGTRDLPSTWAAAVADHAFETLTAVPVGTTGRSVDFVQPVVDPFEPS